VVYRGDGVSAAYQGPEPVHWRRDHPGRSLVGGWFVRSWLVMDTTGGEPSEPWGEGGETDQATRPQEGVSTHSSGPGSPVFVRCNLRLRHRESNRTHAHGVDKGLSRPRASRPVSGGAPDLARGTSKLAATSSPHSKGSVPARADVWRVLPGAHIPEAGTKAGSSWPALGGASRRIPGSCQQ
jgi:hypothetical protein